MFYIPNKALSNDTTSTWLLSTISDPNESPIVSTTGINQPQIEVTVDSETQQQQESPQAIRYMRMCLLFTENMCLATTPSATRIRIDRPHYSLLHLQ